MTSPIGNSRNSDPGKARAGFTLIELILVMALLSIVLAVASPSLSRFFHSRALDSEARRLLALTRYGQSRAVSEGIPMLLWIDEKEGTYGLRAENSFTETDPREVEYRLNQDVTIEVEMVPQINLNTLSRSTPSRSMAAAKLTQDLPTIRFSPDGFVSDTSPERLFLQERDEDAVWIGLSRTRLNYEIQTNAVPLPPIR